MLPAERRCIKQSLMHGLRPCLRCERQPRVAGGVANPEIQALRSDKYFSYSHLLSLNYMHTGRLDIRQLPRSSRASQPFTAAFMVPLPAHPLNPWSMRNEAPSLSLASHFSLSRPLRFDFFVALFVQRPRLYISTAGNMISSQWDSCISEDSRSLFGRDCGQACIMHKLYGPVRSILLDFLSTSSGRSPLQDADRLTIGVNAHP
ncbi:hypothetical protein BJY00DRAFT_286842 [Aspergillus carlsbadensis]|nr:hypothetical protein BJY00DRAFT_286842 [Aspergillus carlsbadensis]